MRMRRLAVLLSIGLLFMFIAACSTKMSEDKIPPRTTIGADFANEDYKEIIPANNDLAFRLYPEIREKESENILISPISLFMALSMVYNSADGDTKSEIAKTLGVEGIDTDHLSQANASLIENFQENSDDVQLDIANSIWMNERFHFKEDFVRDSESYFQANTEEIDVMDGTAPDQINNWVKKSTNDQIDQIVEGPLDTDLVAFLINAIYFNGNWTFPFDEEKTKDRAFHLADGDKKNVPFMKLTKKLAYLENNDFQAVSLPYGDEEEMSMKVFLPKKEDSLQEFEQTLSSQNWAIWNSEFRSREGTILLPKFQLEYEKKLDKDLKQLGMTSAFDKGADFSNLIQENVPVWISEVKQKTFIDVNEKGTEAAGVTSVEMVTESASLDEGEPFQMDVDRPFFIVIADEKTEAILFMGSIYAP